MSSASTLLDTRALRKAILAAQLETSNFGETPEAGMLYLPTSHLKALRLDAHVVVGGRGVGKSFWTAVLQSDELRGLWGSVGAELVGVSVQLGFSNTEDVSRYPNADVFSNFLDQGGDPYDMWQIGRAHV